MNDALIVSIYVILDDLLRAIGHRTDGRAQVSECIRCSTISSHAYGTR